KATSGDGWSAEADAAWFKRWQRVIWNRVFIKGQANFIEGFLDNLAVEPKTFVNISQNQVVTSTTGDQFKTLGLQSFGQGGSISDDLFSIRFELWLHRLAKG